MSTKRTCPICDYPIEDAGITVNVGAKTVVVCCEECAEKAKAEKPQVER